MRQYKSQPGPTQSIEGKMRFVLDCKCLKSPATMTNLLGLAVIAGLISAGSLQNTTPVAESVQSSNLSSSRSHLLSPNNNVPLFDQEPTKRCWTEWFTVYSPPNGGDRELLMSLHRRYPGKICDNPVDMEAQTIPGLYMRGSFSFFKDTSFTCRNWNPKGKKCNYYRVRFSCHAPYCAEEECCLEWTGWFNRDYPSGTGDWETLKDLHKQYPGKICQNPKYIEAVTVDCNIPATATGQDFLMFNPTEGLVCKNKLGQCCLNYKVRFGCCKDLHVDTAEHEGQSKDKIRTKGP